MSSDDVHGDDMTHPELSDEQLAALLEGGSAGAGHPVADALDRARRQLENEPTPTPDAALSEYLGVGRAVTPIPPSGAPIDLAEIEGAADSAPRRTPVLTSLSTFIGTLTGKLLVGTTVAAASVTGAHAAGVVDVPGLPEVDPPAVTETVDDRDTEADDTDTDTDSDDTDTDDTPDDAEDADDVDELADDDDSDDDSDSDADDDSDSDDSHDDDSDSDESHDDDSDDDADDDDSDDDDGSTPTTTVTTPVTTAPTTSTTTAPPTTPSTSTTTVPPVGAQFHSYTVPGVGTTFVMVDANRVVTLVSTLAQDGWTVDEAGPDDDGDGVESKYVNGELETRIDFEVDDGQLRVRIRTENDATDERTERFEYFPL